MSACKQINNILTITIELNSTVNTAFFYHTLQIPLFRLLKMFLI